jgi:hypothetical protein
VITGRGSYSSQEKEVERMPAHRGSKAFSVVVLLTIALYAFVGVVLLQPWLVGGLLGHDTAGHIGQHFRQPHHRVHDLTFSFLMGTAGVGTLVQLRTPSRHVAGQLMSLTPWIALALAFLLSTAWLPFAPAPILAGLTLAATMLHPGVRDFLRSFRRWRANRMMLALVLFAAVPLLALAWTNVGMQRTLTNDHAQLGHYGFMAAFAFMVIGVGLVTSVQPEGWRLTAWVAGLLPALLGIASLLFPAVDSRLAPGWALAAILWGMSFIAAAELHRRAIERGSVIAGGGATP